MDMRHFNAIHRQGLAVFAACVSFALPVSAQYGGRPGDAVVYLVTSKGAQDFRLPGRGATNPAALLSRFQRIDPATVPQTPLGEGFPEEFTHQIFHSEPDDLFQLITQYEGPAGPHRIFSYSLKTFITEGIVRETALTPPIDYTGASFTTLGKNIDFGPDAAIDTLKVLFWGPSNVFPNAVPVPQNVSGSAVPPGLTGDDVVLAAGVVPFFVPWQNMSRKFPGAGWMQGVDLKLIDSDNTVGDTINLMRLRPGTHTPVFQNSGATHLWVLQGTVTLNVPGSGTYVMPPGQYAYLPQALAVTLTNNRVYKGPGSLLQSAEANEVAPVSPLAVIPQ